MPQYIEAKALEMSYKMNKLLVLLALFILSGCYYQAGSKDLVVSAPKDPPARTERARTERARTERARTERARTETKPVTISILREQAILAQARIELAILDQARIEQAILELGNIEQAVLEQARIEQAILDRARLYQASIERARIERASNTAERRE